MQYENIQKAMGVDIAISRKMSSAIYKWGKMYINEAPWLKEGGKKLESSSSDLYGNGQACDNGIENQHHRRSQGRYDRKVYETVFD